MLRRYDRMERVAVLAGGVLLVSALVALASGRQRLLVVSGLGLIALLLLAVLEVRRKVRLEHEATRFHASEGVREATAAMQLVKAISAPAPLPAMGDWAMQPSALLAIWHLVQADRPSLVLELGSGSSTVVIGHAVRGYGGRVVSLEHDEAFAEATREMVRAHHLEETCTVEWAPLSVLAAEDHDGPWYATEALADLTGIGLLVVDGPPELTAPLARAPAMPVLHGRLAPGALVVLDDANRPDEQRILAQWQERFPNLSTVRTIAPRIAVRRVGRQEP